MSAKRSAVGRRRGKGVRVRWQTFRAMYRFWLTLVGLGIVVLSAQMAVLAIASRRAPKAPVQSIVIRNVPPMDTVRTTLPSVTEIAAPATGVTGTTALPALPISFATAPIETGVVAARPFLLGTAGTIDRGRAVQCLTAAIYYEAASESDAGQRAVAQVVLNRVRHPAFPATVCGVVYQGSEHAGCQFSFACDGAMTRTPARAAWARAARVAGMALAGYVYAPVGLATHYHTYAVTPAWNRTLVMTDAVGAHFFHRWKGYWGTAAAFAQRYHGGEPIPGPRAPMVTAAPVDPPPLPQTADAMTVPTKDAVPLPRPAVPPATDNLPPESQILDRWKDSGQPLDR